MARYALALVAIVLVPCVRAVSQTDTPPPTFRDDLRWRLLASLGPQIRFNDVALDIYAGGPDCGQFSGSASFVPTARLFLEMPLWRRASLLLTTGIVYEDRSISLAETAPPSQSRRPDGTEETVVTQHRFEAPMSGVGIGAGLVWEMNESFRVGAVPLISLSQVGEIRQYEQIIDPLGATFVETDTYQRPVYRGAPVEFRTLGAVLSAFVGARMPVGRRLALFPEIGGFYRLNSVAVGTSWRESGVWLSLGVAWESRDRGDTIPAPPLVASIPPPPTVPPDPPLAQPSGGMPHVDPTERKPVLEASIRAVGIDERGQEYENPVIEIVEAPWSRTVPLVPFIFFDSSVASIPARYRLLDSREATERFNVDSLLTATDVDLHHHLLNILGQRMRLRPEVTMTIVGTSSSGEEEGIRLSLARAEAVRSYLRDVWDIDDHRMRIRAGEPTNGSSEETREGRGENRRVEFVFDGENLARPVVVERLARVASPPSILFYPRIVAEAPNPYWQVSVRQGSKILMQFDSSSGGGEEQRKVWKLADMRVARDLTPITYELRVVDSAGQEAVASGEFTVRELTTRLSAVDSSEMLEVIEYPLVGFRYNSADLAPQHRIEIFEIARLLQPGDWVEVEGFTDRVGDSDRNRELAAERAQNVVGQLADARARLGLPAVSIGAVRGYGEGENAYNNDLPEGRIFSRMVRVTIHRGSLP